VKQEDLLTDVRLKAKARDSYIARLAGKPDQPRFTIIGSGSWPARAEFRSSEQAHEANARVRMRIVIGDGLVRSGSSSSSKPVNVLLQRWVSPRDGARSDAGDVLVMRRTGEQLATMDDERMQLTSSAGGTPAILIRKVMTLE